MAGDKWQEATRRILDLLDIQSEYQSLGIDVTGTAPNSNGWLECRTFGKKDANPSAGINVGSDHPRRGRYKQFTGDGLNLSLFEFAAHAGRFSDWKEAKKHYADKTGVSLPKGRRAKRPVDAFEWRDWNENLIFSWTTKKKPIDLQAVRISGGRLAKWPKKSRKFTVVVLPIFGPNLLDDDPVGFTFWNITGKDLELPQSNGPSKLVKQLSATGSGKGWFGRHGLSVLNKAEIIWKVEGPGDMLALISEIARHDPALSEKHVVISNSHGSVEYPDPELLACLSGKTVYVIHDTDKSGQAGGRRWAEAIAEYASEVLFVQLPYEVTDSHGKDIRDFLNDGHSYPELLELADKSEIVVSPEAAIIEPSSGETIQSPRTPSPISPDLVATFSEKQIVESINLIVVGETEYGKIEVFTEFHGKSDIIDVDRLTYSRLLQLCGPIVKEKVNQSKGGPGEVPGEYHISQVKEAISLLAGYERISDEMKRGRGCWEVVTEKENTSSPDTLILVGAGEAAILNGDPGHLELVKKPNYQNIKLDLSSSDSWFEFERLKKYISEYNQEWGQDIINETDALFNGWKWKHQRITPSVTTGLVLASWVQTMWEWRPQISVRGQSMSGKSTFFDILKPIFGNLVIGSSGSSAAGIRQAIGNTASIVLCDELEAGKHRVGILEMLRSSGRGDSVLRGTVGHKKREFVLKHIIWTAAIESGLRREPDKNRFIPLELLKPPEDQMGNLNIPPDPILHDLGQRLLAVAIQNYSRAKKLTHILMKNRLKGANNRISESYSVPASMYAAAAGWDDEKAIGVFHEMCQTFDVDLGGGDAHDLLSDIFDSMVDMGHGRRSSVSQVISWRESQMDDDGKSIGTGLQDLEKIGIKVFEENVLDPFGQISEEGVNPDGYSIEEFLFIAHRPVTRHLLRGTAWEHQNIDEILIRIPGSSKARKRIGGKQPRGILIPMKHVIENHGLEEQKSKF